jgi:hypothetical protein
MKDKLLVALSPILVANLGFSLVWTNLCLIPKLSHEDAERAIRNETIAMLCAPCTFILFYRLARKHPRQVFLTWMAFPALASLTLFPYMTDIGSHSHGFAVVFALPFLSMSAFLPVFVVGLTSHFLDKRDRTRDKI